MDFPVCRLDELPQNKPRTFEVDDYFVVLVRVDDIVHCVEDVCTHDGGTFDDGDYEDFCLVCPRHGAKFDVRTGEAVAMPATEPTRKFQTEVRDGIVYVST